MQNFVLVYFHRILNMEICNMWITKKYQTLYVYYTAKNKYVQFLGVCLYVVLLLSGGCVVCSSLKKKE